MTGNVLLWSLSRQKQLFDILSDTTIQSSGHGTVWGTVKLLLDRAASNMGPERTSGAYYEGADDASAVWVEFGAHMMNALELIEYGTGIGSAWLTGPGSELRDFLTDFGTDEAKWPIWARNQVCEVRASMAENETGWDAVKEMMQGVQDEAVVRVAVPDARVESPNPSCHQVTGTGLPLEMFGYVPSAAQAWALARKRLAGWESAARSLWETRHRELIERIKLGDS